jgi:hypothetical protein
MRETRRRTGSGPETQGSDTKSRKGPQPYQKKYRLAGKCPRCGCGFVNHLSKEEIEKRYKRLDNAHPECGECLARFEEKAKDARPE